MKGSDTNRERGEHEIRIARVVRDSRTPPIICSKIPVISRSVECLQERAEKHSREFFRVMNMRTRVRTTASPIRQAWYAKPVKVSPICDKAKSKSDNTDRR